VTLYGQTLVVQELGECQRKLGITTSTGLGTLTGATDPNGSVTGTIGQVYTQVVGTAVTVWVNVDGGTTWV
jgi:hypothetical protein